MVHEFAWNCPLQDEEGAIGAVCISNDCPCGNGPFSLHVIHLCTLDLQSQKICDRFLLKNQALYLEAWLIYFKHQQTMSVFFFIAECRSFNVHRFSILVMP